MTNFNFSILKESTVVWEYERTPKYASAACVLQLYSIIKPLPLCVPFSLSYFLRRGLQDGRLHRLQ